MEDRQRRLNNLSLKEEKSSKRTELILNLSYEGRGKDMNLYVSNMLKDHIIYLQTQNDHPRQSGKITRL